MHWRSTTSSECNKRRSVTKNPISSLPTSVPGSPKYEADPSIYLYDDTVAGTTEATRSAIITIGPTEYMRRNLSLPSPSPKSLYARSTEIGSTLFGCCLGKMANKHRLRILCLGVTLFLILAFYSKRTIPKILPWLNSQDMIKISGNLQDIIINLRGRHDAVSDDKCNIYLAPSSIPDVALGVFTSCSIKKGENISMIQDGPSIAITDPLNATLPNSKWGWAHEMFTWDVSYDNRESEYSLETVPNLGGMCNYHPYLHNAQCSQTYERYDDSILSRFNDPGAGAVSYHMGKDWFATRDIEAGEEFFLDYGADFFFDWLQLWNVDPDSFLWKRDYLKAARLIQQNRGKDFDGEPIQLIFFAFLGFVFL